MVYKRNTEWRCSIERLDNNKGYNKENTVLICAEFNCIDRSAQARYIEVEGSQWSKEKVTYLLNYIEK